MDFTTRRDDLLSAREQTTVLSFLCDLRDTFIGRFLRRSSLLTAYSSIDRVIKKVQGHCTLVHDLFQKNPRSSRCKPFHAFPCLFFGFPNSRTMPRDADANGFFAFMRVVRSPPLLLATFYSATRSVPWLPWLPSPRPIKVHNRTAPAHGTLHYGGEEKSSIRASRRKANC